jgi:hypothetical protein
MRLVAPLLAALITLSSCATTLPAQRGPVFEYRTFEGKVAHFDISTLTLTAPDRRYQFVPCKLVGFLCFEAPQARIEIPVDCRAEEDRRAMISRKGVTDFLSLDALTGNIFRYDTRGVQFAYAVHPENGLTAFIIPSTSNTSKIQAGELGVQSPYRVVGFKGPFACAPAG